MGPKVLLTALLIGSAAAGCGRNAGMESGQVQPDSGPATINVKNDHVLPMALYAIGNDGVPVKLGTVNPGSTAVFPIPTVLIRLGLVDIVARPAGGGRSVDTGDMGLEPGDIVDFDIAYDLNGSFAKIR